MNHTYTDFKKVGGVFLNNKNVLLRFENEMVAHNLSCLESICDKWGRGYDIPKDIYGYDLLKLTNWLRGKTVRCRVEIVSLQITDIQVANLTYKSSK